MNEKIWARTNRPIQDKTRDYEIQEGAFIRILPWMIQKDHRNIKIEYIGSNGYPYELFVREDHLTKLTKEEVKFMDFLFKRF